MENRTPPFNALRAFEAAARHLSFKLAAAELFVTPTAISHQIRGLESFLGVTLFRRLTRSLELTPQAEAMLPKVREGLQCLDEAIAKVRAVPAEARLIVVAPPSFASRWLVPRLQGFYSHAPKLELHLAASLTAIDRDDRGITQGMETSGKAGDPPRLWIRYGPGVYPGFRSDLLFRPRYTAICSPTLLRAKIPLRQPSDLHRHALIHDDTIPDARSRPSWGQWLEAAGVTGVNSESGTHFSDSGLAIAAALDGLGIALAARPLVETEVAAGRLVAPFDIDLQPLFAYHLVCHERFADHPSVDAFRNWLLDAAQTKRDRG